MKNVVKNNWNLNKKECLCETDILDSVYFTMILELKFFFLFP